MREIILLCALYLFGLMDSTGRSSRALTLAEVLVLAASIAAEVDRNPLSSSQEILPEQLASIPRLQTNISSVDIPGQSLGPKILMKSVSSMPACFPAPPSRISPPIPIVGRRLVIRPSPGVCSPPAFSGCRPPEGRPAEDPLKLDTKDRRRSPKTAEDMSRSTCVRLCHDCREDCDGCA